jgi:hypothetical protein
MNSYLMFETIVAPGLTCRWRVRNLDGELLGGVGWHSSWRQYVFFPISGTLLDSKCLAELAAFLQNHHEDRCGQSG